MEEEVEEGEELENEKEEEEEDIKLLQREIHSRRAALRKLQENAADVLSGFQWKLLRDGRRIGRRQHPGGALQGSWKPFWHRCANKSRSDTGKKVNTKQSRYTAVPVERYKKNQGENMLELSYVYFYITIKPHILLSSVSGVRKKKKIPLTNKQNNVNLKPICLYCFST